MAQPKVQMKISKGQYKALLDRITTRNQATSQSSMETMGMDPNMMGGGGGLGMGMGGAPQPMAPPTGQPPMMGESGIPTPTATPGAPMMPGVPDPSALPMQEATAPVGVGGLPSLQDSMGQVVEIWRQLKGGIGEQLWQRLAEFADPRGAKNPEGFFIQEATKYMTNPASVADERVRKFLASILGESSPAQGGGDAADVIAGLIQ